MDGFCSARFDATGADALHDPNRKIFSFSWEVGCNVFEKRSQYRLIRSSLGSVSKRHDQDNQNIQVGLFLNIACESL